MSFFSDLAKGFTSSAASIGGDLLGGLINKDASRNAAGLNRDMQREFAQKGIRWKVEDARAAGLHPLAALGAQTSSFSPTFVGDNMGTALASAGQDISRAMRATQTSGERSAEDAIRYGQANQLANLGIERARLENDLLRARIAREASAQLGPGFPTGGTPEYSLAGPGHVAGPGLSVRRGSAPGAGAVEIKPSEITSRSPTDSSSTAGRDPMWTEYEVMPGQSLYLPSKNASEPLESIGAAGAVAATIGKNAAESAKWLLKKFNGGEPPSIPLPSGYHWEWSTLRQSWRATRN